MFWSRPLVSPDMAHWIADCFDWFDSKFPPPAGPILPTRTFFRAGKGKDHTTAKQVLADVTRLMGYRKKIALEPLNQLPANLRHSYQALSDVGGTYQAINGRAVIHYDREQMQRPILFINTMAHEVMHARLAGKTHQVPGGEGAHELATDLGCIIAGFGVFQLQAADDAGWAGYMTQSSRAYALAMFLRRRDLDESTVADHLSGRCRRLLKKAIRQLP